MLAPVPLSGVILPLTTPFRNGEIDEPAFRAQVEWALGQGAHGIVVGGSTGEGYALDEDELYCLSQAACAVVHGRVPVLASIIVDSTRAAMRRADRLAGLPLAALQAAPPHYIFQPSREGLLGFYRDLADATPLPVVIYNVVPWCQVDPRLAAEIMEAAPGVAAIKQSEKDFGAYASLVEAVGPDRVFAAIDGGLMSCYELGAAGSIAAIASAAPRASVALWDAVQAGDRPRARRLHAGLLTLWDALAAPNLPARVKAAQAAAGLSPGEPRAPMEPASADVRRALDEALRRLNHILSVNA
jgi:dihydrodipicolinate synthase/N-acetylneuraminate lyase